MNTHPPRSANSPRLSKTARRLLTLLLVVAAVVVAAGGAYIKFFALRGDKQEPSTFTTRRGPLVISISESGTINNRDQVMLKSEVVGRTTILKLIAEGTHVEVGDELVKLDASPMEDARTQQQITVLNAEAAYIRTRENLEVTKSQGESDVAKAQLAYEFAQLDLKKYVEGDYPKQLQQAQSEITIANEERERAADKLDWSRRLSQEGYITQTELLADELALKRSTINLELAETNLQLLEKFTRQRDLQELESNVEQTRMALDRATRKASADNVQAEAELKAKDSEFERQKDILGKIDEQITKCVITAPVAGMVVYATTGQGSWRGNAEPLAEGQEVREMQELIRLPTTSSMTAEVKVHESSLRKVKPGMPVRITVDAVPGHVFFGRVGKIALLPDALSAWLNPDLTVYSTGIDIEGDASLLRPGMTCRAEMIVAEYEDAVYAPVQSVVRVNGQTVVYLDKGDTPPEKRPVTVGLDNNRMIHILDGLAEGERVLLNPPLEPSTAPTTDEQFAGLPDEETPKEAAPQDAASADPQEGRGNGDMPKIDFSKLRDMTPEQRVEFIQKLPPEQQEALKRMASQMGSGQGGQGGGRRGDRRQGGPGNE